MSLRKGIYNVRKIIHTTPLIRDVAKGFASAWGGGEAWDKFDKKIGYTGTGEPVPASEGDAPFRMDLRGDLAGYVSEKYPNANALVQTYRQSGGAGIREEGVARLRQRYGGGVMREQTAEPEFDEEPFDVDEEEEEEEF